MAISGLTYVGHVEVHENQVVTHRCDLFESLDPILRGAAGTSLLQEMSLEAHPLAESILHHQHNHAVAVGLTHCCLGLGAGVAAPGWGHQGLDLTRYGSSGLGMPPHSPCREELLEDWGSHGLAEDLLVPPSTLLLGEKVGS